MKRTGLLGRAGVPKSFSSDCTACFDNSGSCQLSHSFSKTNTLSECDSICIVGLSGSESEACSMVNSQESVIWKLLGGRGGRMARTAEKHHTPYNVKLLDDI